MYSHRTALLIMSVLTLLAFAGIASAQEPLPLPLAGDSPSLEVTSGILEYAGTRADPRTNYMKHYYYFRDKKKSWDGSNIDLDLYEVGPVSSGVTFSNISTTRGYCSILNAGTSIDCNFGTVPKKEQVVITFTSNLNDSVDWYRIWDSNGVYSRIATHVWDPVPYAANLVADPSFENPQQPRWSFSGGAKRQCNKPNKYVSYSGSCALYIPAGATATFSYNLPEVYAPEDSMKVYFVRKSIGLGTPAKITLLLKHPHTPSSKATLKIVQGTSSYASTFAGMGGLQNSSKFIVKFTGGKSGKLYIDSMTAYMVDLDDLQ